MFSSFASGLLMSGINSEVSLFIHNATRHQHGYYNINFILILVLRFKPIHAKEMYDILEDNVVNLSSLFSVMNQQTVTASDAWGRYFSSSFIRQHNIFGTHYENTSIQLKYMKISLQK